MSLETRPKPLFEPTDLLGFGPLPTPPTSNVPDTDQSSKNSEDGAGKDMQMDLDIDDYISSMRGNASANPIKMDSPPPDFDEEPSDLEDELMALQEMEEESRIRSDTQTMINDLRDHDSSTLGSDGRSFIPSGLLSFGNDIDQPIASSSRIFLTPPPEVDLSSIIRPTERCDLPPIHAETSSGKTISFKRRAKPKVPIVFTDRDSHGVSSHLLDVPLHRLLAEVDELKSQRKGLLLQRSFDTEQKKAEHRNRPSKTLSHPSMTMWVDKYRPKKFSDLLGEDRVHREVMTWLKEWDKCVFRRVIPGKKRRAEEGEDVYVDHLGRPRERILLLSGPPGFGKTTLAHIVAHHAGYRTLEINASDDRSAATVSTRIKNAIDAGSGLGAEGKPTCVVIDEIDGASGGGDTSFVKSLIKLIQDVPARKRSNTPARPLRRPIICICNDLYSPALRPLRPFARIIRFKKPQSQFLVKRLRDICDRETLSADLRVLTNLVEVTSGDVRSCLNTLQFIKSKSSTVTDEAIKSSSVGLKDSGTSLQQIWNNIFIPIAAKQRRKTSAIDDGKYVNRLSFEIQACGDYDKIVSGLFEHYPNLKPLDTSLNNISKMLDHWLGYFDRLSGKVSEGMEWDLMAYIPYALVPWYSHFAAPANNARLTEWPKADYEAYQARTINEEISTSLKNTVPPILRSIFSTTTTLTELIPLLMRIISPPLKPVNANIVKSTERVVLTRLVELMIGLGLKFWSEKGEDGQPMMRLEPPIDVFVHYDGKRAGDIAASRFAVRQLVAQAMDAEIAHRKGAAGAAATDGAASYTGMYGLAKNGLTGNPSKVEDAAKPALDFFGRLKAVPAVLNLETGVEEVPQLHSEPLVKRFRAVYKFNEGSSSAVRQSIKMSALM